MITTLCPRIFHVVDPRNSTHFYNWNCSGVLVSILFFYHLFVVVSFVGFGTRPNYGKTRPILCTRLWCPCPNIAGFIGIHFFSDISQLPVFSLFHRFAAWLLRRKNAVSHTAPFDRMMLLQIRETICQQSVELQWSCTWKELSTTFQSFQTEYWQCTRQ